MGDVVGYGAEPVRCLETVRELGCDTIAGNHDWAAIERISIDFFNAYAKATAIWTREQLSDEHKEWLADLPLHRSYDHCTVAHGTFHQPEAFNYIQTVFDAQLSFEALKTHKSSVGFLGHSHVPVAFFDTDPLLTPSIPTSRLTTIQPLSLTSVPSANRATKTPRHAGRFTTPKRATSHCTALSTTSIAAAAKIREAGPARDSRPAAVSR